MSTVEFLAMVIGFTIQAGGLGYLIWIDYRARNTFTPGEAAIFKEMRRVLEETRP
jgi:hypothetical protein